VATIPAAGGTPLIRTDFSDERAWRDVARAAVAENDDGFQARLAIVDDPGFDGSAAERLARLAATETLHACLFLADATTMIHADHPLLSLDLRPPGRSFRVMPAALWGVENNLAIANMDFEEFADAVDEDGIFRGFR
jgi:hypothetical protein